MSRSVRFLTRDGCSLCDDALPRVRRIAPRLGLEVEVLDVDAAGLAGAYGERIPVLLGRDDRVLAEGRMERLWWPLFKERLR